MSAGCGRKRAVKAQLDIDWDARWDEGRSYHEVTG